MSPRRRGEKPGRRAPLLVVGLTGGIASGKTTVAGLFAELGAVVLNADEEARAVVAPGEPALAEIIAAFGPKYLRADGTLDRRALGERVFASASDRRVLNRITHPRIARRLERRLEALRRNPPESGVVVLEAAILIEAGWARLVDRVVVVTAQQSTQVQRLIAGLSLPREQAEARVRAQMPPEARLRHADFRISGETPLSESRQRVREIWNELRRPAPRRPVGKRPLLTPLSFR